MNIKDHPDFAGLSENDKKILLDFEQLLHDLAPLSILERNKSLHAKYYHNTSSEDPNPRQTRSEHLLADDDDGVD